MSSSPLSFYASPLFFIILYPIFLCNQILNYLQGLRCQFPQQCVASTDTIIKPKLVRSEKWCKYVTCMSAHVQEKNNVVQIFQCVEVQACTNYYLLLYLCPEWGYQECKVNTVHVLIRQDARIGAYVGMSKWCLGGQVFFEALPIGLALYDSKATFHRVTEAERQYKRWRVQKMRGGGKKVKCLLLELTAEYLVL